MARNKIRRGPGQREICGKDFRLAEEVRYIQRRAAEFDARFVTVGPLALFSTDTGDAWLLDPADVPPRHSPGLERCVIPPELLATGRIIGDNDAAHIRRPPLALWS